MEHVKELELNILLKLLESGNIELSKFTELFSGDWDDYKVVFYDLVNSNYIKKSNDANTEGCIIASVQISDKGKLRLKVLTQENMVEANSFALQLKANKDSSIVSGWTIFLGIVGFLTLIATLFLIYLTYHPPH